MKSKTLFLFERRAAGQAAAARDRGKRLHVPGHFSRCGRCAQDGRAPGEYDFLASIRCRDYAVCTRILHEQTASQPRRARLMENALLFFQGERYELHAWVVMPNHVHALFKVGKVAMENIVESWKSYTANEANKLLNRRGRFWQPGC